jgi:hypothetical protein
LIGFAVKKRIVAGRHPVTETLDARRTVRMFTLDKTNFPNAFPSLQGLLSKNGRFIAGCKFMPDEQKARCGD